MDENDDIKHRAAVVLTNVMTHDKEATSEIIKSEIFDILTAYAAGTTGCPAVVTDMSVNILKMLVEEKFVEANDEGKPYRPQYEPMPEADEEINQDSDSDLD